MISDFLAPEWGWLKDDEEYVPPIHSQTHSHGFLARHVSYSGLARIVMDTLQPIISCDRLIL